jgi:predicted Zn finger-like uncharacterized protein
MSLAARCPACGTVFRVVQDQLRVSEGWVRCGRCAEVFNAIETLVDLDTEAAARPAPRAARSERVLDDLARVSQSHDLEVPAPAVRAGPTMSVDLEVPDAPPDGVDARGDSDVAAPAVAPPSPSKRAAPAFIVQADRAARWRRPGVRLLLAVVGFAGSVLLAWQVAHEYRDLVAARWPSTRDPLERLCAWQGCRIEAPRSIEGLAVESSGLARAEGASSYRLSIVLRNRTPLAIALPAIDLTLTDTQGGVIARRVIRASEMGLAQSSVPPLADLPMQALLAATERPISGYTIEIFYP